LAGKFNPSKNPFRFRYVKHSRLKTSQQQSIFQVKSISSAVGAKDAKI